MKKTKIILAVVLTFVMCMAFVSCGGEKITVNVKITSDVENLGDDIVAEVELSGKEATVLNAVSEFCTNKEYSYEYNAEGDSLASIGGYVEKEENRFSYFWNFTVNGAEVGARAAEYTLADGDTVVYNYTSMPIGDSVSVKLIADGETILDTLAPIDAGSTVYDAAETAFKNNKINYNPTEFAETFTMIADFPEKVTPAYEENWEFSIGGKKQDALENEVTVKNGDKIVFELIKKDVVA